MELEYFLHVFKKSSNIKYHENQSSGSPAVPCGRMKRQTDENTDVQTDMTKPIFAFSNFANEPKKNQTPQYTKFMILTF
jgi:hypothetical protein